MATQHIDDEQLSAYIDRALTHREAGLVAEHLDVCSDCAARVHLLRATSVAVASLPEEELPRPLDFSFLRDGAADEAAAGDGDFTPRVVRGRFPTWLPTLVAAAAVLALVATWVPRLVPTGRDASQATNGSARTTAGGGAQAFAQVSPSSPLGALSQDRTQAGPALAAPAGAPGQSLAGGSQKTAVGPDGSTITLLANPPNATSGQPVQLLLRLVGGPRGTDLASPGMEIFAGHDQAQLRVAGSEGTSRTLKSGEELDLTVEWSAGAVSGPPAPGTYTLTGRVFLKNSNVVEVRLTYTVG